MSKLILGYWKIRGLAESIRLLLHYLEIEYKEELVYGVNVDKLNVVG